MARFIKKSAILSEEMRPIVEIKGSIVKKLEQSDLIVRSTSKKDPSANLISLTKSRQDMLEVAVPLAERIDEVFFSSLGVEE